MESPQREASFEHKKNIPTQKINVWKKCLKNQKFSFCVLEFDKFPFRVVRRSMAQSIARRLKQLLIYWTPSNSKGKWVQCYLPRQKTRFSRLNFRLYIYRPWRLRGNLIAGSMFNWAKSAPYSMGDLGICKLWSYCEIGHPLSIACVVWAYL